MASPTFKFRKNRLSSYNSAPWHLQNKFHSFVDAGFFYTRKNDTVQCFMCHIQINNWIVNQRPLNRHRQLSPECQFVQKHDKIRPKKILLEILQNPSAKMMARHYFQAVYRLQHYLSFPFLEIADKHIDKESNTVWETLLSPLVKQIYLDIRRKLLRRTGVILKSVNRLITTPDTPMDWFIRVSQIRDWKNYQKISTEVAEPYLMLQWFLLSNEQREPYQSLSIIDKKRSEAELIYSHLASQGLEIGLSDPTVPLITIDLTNTNNNKTTISQKLFTQISFLIIQEESTDDNQTIIP